MKFIIPIFFLSLLSCSPDKGAAAGAMAGMEERSGGTVSVPEIKVDSADHDTLPPNLAPAAAPLDSDGKPIMFEPTYEYCTGRFDPAQNPDFVKVAAEYTDGDPYLLRKETYAAFEKMHAAAKAVGVKLTLVSATRNFARQKQIWEAKWTGKRLLEGKDKADVVYPDPADRARAILRYSSMPGTSRHHWGTDIDINNLNNSYFAAGKGKIEYDWLIANAGQFGFGQPYTPKGNERPQGYEEEKWHWSYTPISGPLTAYASAHLSNDMVAGFAGAESAQAIDVVKNYVLGINQDCRK